MIKIKKIMKKTGSIFLVALLLTGCGKSESGMEKDYTQKNMEAESQSVDSDDSDNRMPAFETKDLNGNTVTEAIFSDKDLTVVNIWGTFCSPCIREMPELGEWARELPENVQIVGVVCDIAGEEDTEHRDLAMEIAEEAGADYVQLIANEDFSDITGSVIGVPTTLFVDKEGNIVGDWIIGADVDKYRKFVDKYLEEQQADEQD